MEGDVSMTGNIVGFVHSGITVKDLENSLHFYVDKLGLKVLSKQVAQDEYISRIVNFSSLKEIKIAFLEIPGGNQIEMLEYVGVERLSGSVRPCDYGSGHICLLVNDLEQMYERLKKQGVKFRSENIVEITAGANKGNKAIYMYDPDNYVIELMEKKSL